MSSHYLHTTSTLDGSPLILAISASSKNRKTGGMLQAWILKRNVSPVVAVRDGQDGSVCGDCSRRWSLGGDCYVIPGRGPLNVWKSCTGFYGSKSTAKPLDLNNPPVSLMRKSLRLGAYGDPAAVSFKLWSRVIVSLKVRNWTGYTHQWRTCDTRFQKLVMASADSKSDRLEARALGWRTFRVRSTSEPLLAGEFECPASAEQGKRLTCETCLACDGGSVLKASPSIVAHGPRNRNGLIGLRVS